MSKPGSGAGGEPGVPPVPPGLTVLYADRELIALDKPAGLHTAPSRAGEDTLLGRLLERFPEMAALPGRKPNEPGLLHRLDRGTSGVVLSARTPESFDRLAADFAAGRVRKEYLAVCAPRAAGATPAVGQSPDVPPRAGQPLVLESRFVPYGPGRKKVRVVPAGAPGPRGRGRARRKASPESYRTEAEVVQVRGGLALVRAVILRGFRHQVRAHLSHLGLPILGDELYGRPVPSGARARLYLHASAVELAHPADGRRLRIESPLPLDFAPWYGRASGGKG
jgi:23S rRNA pseudouridine1911/1915/1917 synthase